MEWSYPLLDQRNLLSIGWSDFGCRRDFVRKHQDDWSSVPCTIEREWGKARARFGLQRFLEMEQGDWVVVPSWGIFHVYRVVDNDRLVPEQIEVELEGIKSWNDKSATIRNGFLEEQGTRVDPGSFGVWNPLLGISLEMDLQTLP